MPALPVSLSLAHNRAYPLMLTRLVPRSCTRVHQHQTQRAERTRGRRSPRQECRTRRHTQKMGSSIPTTSRRVMSWRRSACCGRSAIITDPECALCAPRRSRPRKAGGRHGAFGTSRSGWEADTTGTWASDSLLWGESTCSLRKAKGHLQHRPGLWPCSLDTTLHRRQSTVIINTKNVGRAVGQGQRTERTGGWAATKSRSSRCMPSSCVSMSICG